MTAKIKSLRLMLLALVMLMLSIRVADAQEISYVNSSGLNKRSSIIFSKKILPERDTLRKTDPTKGEYPDCSPAKNVRWLRNVSDKIQVEWDGVDARPQVVHYKVRFRAREDLVWDETLVTTGRQVVLALSLKDDSPLWVEVQKLCFDAQSNEWIKSLWVETESDGRAAIPCSVTTGNTYKDIVIKDLWATGARVEISNLNTSIDINTMKYYWVLAVKDPTQSVFPTTPKNFKFEAGTTTGIVDFPSNSTEGVKLVITGTTSGNPDVCTQNSNIVYFTCAKYGIDVGASLIGGAMPRFQSVSAAAINLMNTQVSILGDNANFSKGMHYVVKYQAYLNGSPFGSLNSLIVKSRKDTILTNLVQGTTYQVKVELWYNNALCKELNTSFTTPACNAIASLGSVTGNAISISLGNTYQASASNFASVQLLKNGVKIGSPQQITTGNYTTFSPLDAGTTYEIELQYYSNGFACPIQKLTATTIVDCSFYTGLTANISTLSGSSVKVTSSKAAIAPFIIDVKYRLVGATTYLLAGTILTGTNSLVVTGLQANKAYEFELIPRTGESTACNATTQTYTIDCNTISAEFQDFLVQVQNSNATIKIVGSPAGSGITYLIEHRKSNVSQWSSLLITSGLTSLPIPLSYSPGYEVKVTMKLNDVVCKSVGPKTFGLFDCTDFKAAKDSAVTYNSAFLVMNGPSIDSVVSNTYYAIQYQENGSGKWSNINCIKGKVFALKNLKSNTDYDVQITLTLKNSVAVCSPIKLSFKTLPFVVPSTLKCGGNAPIPSNISTVPYSFTLLVGDVITMFGFPIEIDAIQVNNGVYNGTGFLSIPFADSVVHVNLANVEINDLKQAHKGMVTSVADPSGKTITFGGGALNFGGPICVKKPEATDANGFDEDGNYVANPPYTGYQPGMPIDSTQKYDPCGFDKNGKHKDTDSDTNETGCTREDIKAGKTGCLDCYKAPNAYSWLGASGPGAALYAKFKDSLEVWTVRELSKLRRTNSDSIKSKGLVCGAYRAAMRETLTQLSYDSTFVFGNESRYLEEGMSYRFVSTPLPMQFESDKRNIKAIDLEKKHIALYACDLQLTKFKMADTLLGMMMVDPELGKLVNIIANTIKAMNKADSTKYATATALKGKINEIAKLQIENRTSTGTITAVSNPSSLFKHY
jgi:hypothetical protein